MKADSADKPAYPIFAGIRGLLLLTLIVLLASFLIGLGYGVAVLGRRNAIAAFLSASFIGKLTFVSLVLSLVFWLRFWRQRRSRGIR